MESTPFKAKSYGYRCRTEQYRMKTIAGFDRYVRKIVLIESESHFPINSGALILFLKYPTSLCLTKKKYGIKP